METLLTLHDISKTFSTKEGPFRALRNISLTLHKGEMLGIAGKSGCGKSTLLQILSGMEKPDRGGLHWEEEIEGPFYRFVQMVFQNPSDAFSPRMTAGEFLREPIRNFHLCPKGEEKKLLEDALRLTDLPSHVLDALPHRLSGGQLQRIVIARALLIKPKLILFDEPTSALDVITQKNILALIRHLHETIHFTGVFVSHDLAAVQAVTDRIILMENGQIVERLPSADLKKAIHPASRRLLDAQIQGREEIIPEPEGEILLYEDRNFHTIDESSAEGLEEKDITLSPDHQVLAGIKKNK